MKMARCCAELGLGLGFLLGYQRGYRVCAKRACVGSFSPLFCLRLVKLLTASTVLGRSGGVALRVLAPLIREGFFLSASLRFLVLVNLFLTAF
jgi:hypothetical protein